MVITLEFQESQYLFKNEKGDVIYLKVVACDDGSSKFFLYINGKIVLERSGDQLSGTGCKTLTEVTGTHWVPILVHQLLTQYNETK